MFTNLFYANIGLRKKREGSFGYMTKPKLVIFDLDGTLYEGTDHFDYYAEHLLNQVVDVDKKEAFLVDYNRMKNGEHAVAIGKAYDVEKDLVLTIDPMTLHVTQATNWDGTSVNVEYEEALQFNFKDMIAIGDGWWLPFVTAKHYGVKDCYPSYLATKEYMVTDEFTLERLEGLREYLLELREETSIVLMTNSDSEDVGRLFKELDLEDVFEHVVTSAQKPTYTTDLFKELLIHYKVNPEEALSVGDNFINEIAPALLLGMKAAYITPHPFAGAHKQLKVIPSVTALYQ